MEDLKPEVQSPISIFLEAAVQRNELFKTLMEAGFTEHQALVLVIGMVTGGQQP